MATDRCGSSAVNAAFRAGFVYGIIYDKDRGPTVDAAWAEYEKEFKDGQ